MVKRIAPTENEGGGWDKIEQGIMLTKKEVHDGNSGSMTEIALDRTFTLSESSLTCIEEETQGSPSKTRSSSAFIRTCCFGLSWVYIKRLKEVLRETLESNTSNSIMGVVTIYALFGDDIRQLAFSALADKYFSILSIIAFFLFVLEMVISMFVLPGYMSFYFYLDFLASASFFGELGMLWSYENDVLQSARAGRITKVGVRAGRLFRVFRMVRLWRLAKPLYKYTLGFLNGGANGDMNANKPVEKEGVNSLPPESFLGKNISNLTTKRVIVGILGMLVVIPLLTYTSTDQSSSFGISLIHNFAVSDMNGETAAPGLDTAVNVFTSEIDGVLVVDINGEVIFEAENAYDKKLRGNEKVALYVTEALGNGDTFTTKAVLLVRKQLEKVALLNILLTIVIIILLLGGSMVCSRDVNRIVLLPIETLMQLVQNITRNPLDFSLDVHHETVFEEGFETTKLLNTVCKIAGLMKVGFGEAGADIISRNLQESHNQKLNLLVSSRRST